MNYDDEKIKVPRFNEESSFYTTKQRSKQMSRIRGRDTKPEIAFRKELWRRGYRYRINYRKLIGKPDLVLIKHKIVVFIDGEFWHGYQWEEKKHQIKSNRGFWIPKIQRNMQRDREVNTVLSEKGFEVFRFWEKDIKKDLQQCVQSVVEYIENNNKIKSG